MLLLPDEQLQLFEGRVHLQWDPLGISYEQVHRGRTCTPSRIPLSQDPAIVSTPHTLIKHTILCCYQL